MEIEEAGERWASCGEAMFSSSVVMPRPAGGGEKGPRARGEPVRDGVLFHVLLRGEWGFWKLCGEGDEGMKGESQAGGDCATKPSFWAFIDNRA